MVLPFGCPMAEAGLPASTNTSTSQPKVYLLVVKWCRRLTAVGAWFLVVQWMRGSPPPLVQIEQYAEPVLRILAPMPVHRTAMAAVIFWYAFLSQLKIRWAFWLPVYVLVSPPWWVLYRVTAVVFWLLGKTFASLVAPLFQSAQTAVENPAGQKSATTQPAKQWPKKKLWVLLFFVWLVAFRGLDIWWAAWLAPALAVPVWLFFVRTAYRCAVTPKTAVTAIARWCGAYLDTQIKSLNEAREKNAKIQSAAIVYNFIAGVLHRYGEDGIQSVVQREAMTIFSVALSVALLASSAFWGLVGVAIAQTQHEALDAYGFFSTGSFLESVLWAWGCMTTAIAFPGHLAPTWLKFVHGCVLATGVFQLTFLLVCFSIMINAETTRAVAEATAMIRTAREKLTYTRALEGGMSSGKPNETLTTIDAQVVQADESKRDNGAPV